MMGGDFPKVALKGVILVAKWRCYYITIMQG